VAQQGQRDDAAAVGESGSEVGETADRAKRAAARLTQRGRTAWAIPLRVWAGFPGGRQRNLSDRGVDTHWQGERAWWGRARDPC
jgi:hypothetical protein